MIGPRNILGFSFVFSLYFIKLHNVWKQQYKSIIGLNSNANSSKWYRKRKKKICDRYSGIIAAYNWLVYMKLPPRLYLFSKQRVGKLLSEFWCDDHSSRLFWLVFLFLSILKILNAEPFHIAYNNKHEKKEKKKRIRIEI